jgi:hypothetical protein
MELQAVTGLLHIVGGEVEDQATVPGLLAQSAPAKAARGRERDFLFVHLAFTGLNSATAVLAQDLLDKVASRYFGSSGSVTAALRRAVLEVNELLLRLNLSGEEPAREGAISCASLHNGELFLLQAGEALALLGHNFGVERVDHEDSDQITPLGQSAGLDIRYHHYRLQSGNMLLLADPRIAHLATEQLKPALVDVEVEFGLEALRQAVGDESARLLLIEFTEDAPSDLPEIAQPIDSGRDSLATIPAPRPLRERSPSSAGASQDASPTLPSELIGGRKRDGEGPSSDLRLPVDVETTARRATSQAALGLAGFTGWLAVLLERLRPPRRSQTDATSWAIPAMLTVLIPIIVAGVVTGVYLQGGRVRQFADLRVEIGQHIAEAQQAGDDQLAARDHYDAALILASEAESLRAGDDEIRRLRVQALTALDVLDGVTRLAAWPLHQYDEQVRLTRVVLREGFNGGIYTLDGADDAIYAHDTDESYMSMTAAEPQRVLFSGQAVGNHVVGKFVDMMWRPRGNAVSRDGLAVLDRGGVLLSYYPNFSDIRAVPLGLASEWRAPQSITSFDERLYLLDTGANEIWRYFPDGDGFVFEESDRTITFDEDPGLTRAMDIAIYSEDGSLLVLYADGRIRYYDTRSSRIQWDESDLMENGLVAPFVAPTVVKLVGKGLNASIFVADPGSGRIVQMSRGGRVLAQYRATDSLGLELFTSLSDFAVAETPLRLFVTSGNTLHIATQQ